MYLSRQAFPSGAHQEAGQDRARAMRRLPGTRPRFLTGAARIGFIGAFCLLLFVPANGFAQVPALDPPLAGRPTNFSQLVGRFTIVAKVEPSEVIVEDPMTLRVIIAGDVAAGDPPSRTRLRIFPDNFGDSFYIEPVPDQDSVKPEDKTWSFVWRLRAKSIEVRELPSLVLAYYSPQLRRYQTARSEPIFLNIKSRPRATLEASVPDLPPEAFLELEKFSATPRRWSIHSRVPTCGTIEWMSVALVLAWVSWRRGAVLAKREKASHGQRSSRESVTAVAALRQNPVDPAAVVTRYLQVRYGLAAVEPSNDEIYRALKRNGVPSALRESWVNWIRAAARRFAPVTIDRLSADELAREAIVLIQNLEARP